MAEVITLWISQDHIDDINISPGSALMHHAINLSKSINCYGVLRSHKRPHETLKPQLKLFSISSTVQVSFPLGRALFLSRASKSGTHIVAWMSSRIPNVSVIVLPILDKQY